MLSWSSDTDWALGRHCWGAPLLGCWYLLDRWSTPWGADSPQARKASRYCTICLYRWWIVRALSPPISSLDSMAISIWPSHFIPTQTYASTSWDHGKEVCFLRHRELESFQIRYSDPIVLSWAQQCFAWCRYTTQWWNYLYLLSRSVTTLPSESLRKIILSITK